MTGRLNQVTGHSQTFTISYLANSHLIDEVESGSFERHINRQTNSHRVSSIENEWSETDRVNFTYSYDTLGRVSTRIMTGTIEDAYGSNTTELRDTYAYNDRHELTSAKTESKISSWPRPLRKGTKGRRRTTEDSESTEINRDQDERRGGRRPVSCSIVPPPGPSYWF